MGQAPKWKLIVILHDRLQWCLTPFTESTASVLQQQISQLQTVAAKPPNASPQRLRYNGGMQFRKYIIAYIIFLAATNVALLIELAMGEPFYELGVGATFLITAIFASCLYCVGLIYLFIGSKVSKTDFARPTTDIYIWSLVYGCIQGAVDSVYFPYVPSAVWLTTMLNGLPVRALVPGLVVTAIYLALRHNRKNAI
jgi:hypothetical protein